MPLAARSRSAEPYANFALPAPPNTEAVVADKRVTLAVVIPVYQGEHTLGGVVDELISRIGETCGGLGVELAEVLLANDGAPDGSAGTIVALEERHDIVRGVWLTRNFGQHAATLAGIAATTADWIVTMDEDGLHDPADVVRILTVARDSAVDLVYAHPSGGAPHAAWRNATSAAAKRIGKLLLGEDAPDRFASYRLVDGQIARAIAAYCGHAIYLDVAFRWATTRIGHADVTYRPEQREGPSGYDLGRLLSHFRRLVLTSGTRPLRLVSTIGLLAVLGGGITAMIVLVGKLAGVVEAQGWASVMIALSITTGLVLLSLGVIAEYLGATLGMAMGRPPYLVVDQRPRLPGEL
jgi:glycosyltransferase involved in cell wall biosynthesis